METIETIIGRLSASAQQAGHPEATALLSGCATRGELLEALLEHVNEWQSVDDHWLPILKAGLPADAYLQLTDGYLRDRLLDTLRAAGIEVVTDRSLIEAALGKEGVRQHRVYHGSGASFSQFDSQWIGTGQGVASYGWGFYFTEVESIGWDYAKDLAGIRLSYKGVLMDTSGLYNPWRLIADTFAECNKRLGDTRNRLDRLGDLAEPGPMKFAWRKALEMTNGIRYGELKIEPERVLYTVDIPDDLGDNYLAWELPVTESLADLILDELSNQPSERAGRIAAWVDRQLLDEIDDLQWATPEDREDIEQGEYAKHLPSDVLRDLLEQYTDLYNGCKGSDLYEQVTEILGSGSKCAEFFNDLGIVGISYPTQYLCRGGREDGARNYVIFNTKDIFIDQKLRFMRDEHETVYGLTDGERIYVDRSVATAATPIHEYAHLWITAYSRQCPEEWAELTQSLKGTPQWAETVARYPELKTDSEIADELLASFSGARGRERLLSELDRSGSEGWAGCIQSALRQVWRWVGGLFHSPTAKLEYMADRILEDLLRQRNPIQGFSMERKGEKRR